MARKLRIAVSVFFGVLTVALLVLWVRSNWWNEIVSKAVGTTNTATAFGMNYGQMYVIHSMHPSWDPHPWRLSSVEAKVPKRDFRFDVGGPERVIILPFWLLTSMAATAAYSPWFRWSFSLRTLLIATTLVAVVLGLAVWAGR